MIVNLLISLIAGGLLGLAIYWVVLSYAANVSQIETGILIAVAIASGTFVYVFMSL